VLAEAKILISPDDETGTDTRFVIVWPALIQFKLDASGRTLSAGNTVK